MSPYSLAALRRPTHHANINHVGTAPPTVTFAPQSVSASKLATPTSGSPSLNSSRESLSTRTKSLVSLRLVRPSRCQLELPSLSMRVANSTRLSRSTGQISRTPSTSSTLVRPRLVAGLRRSRRTLAHKERSRSRRPSTPSSPLKSVFSSLANTRSPPVSATSPLPCLPPLLKVPQLLADLRTTRLAALVSRSAPSCATSSTSHSMRHSSRRRRTLCLTRLTRPVKSVPAKSASLKSTYHWMKAMKIQMLI